MPPQCPDVRRCGTPCELVVLDHLPQAFKAVPPAPRVAPPPTSGLEPLLYERDLGRAVELIEVDAHEALRPVWNALPSDREDEPRGRIDLEVCAEAATGWPQRGLHGDAPGASDTQIDLGVR